MSPTPIRVAIIDDSPKLRKQLVKLIAKEPDLCVVAEAETGLAEIKELKDQKPDVILMDKNNPFTDGLEATSLIVSRFPDTRIVIISMPSKNHIAASSCQTFACYSMCENCSDKEILAAIRGIQ
jgi:DNA-binding NarL/FixJ family response regulator